jgi:hypothetical protein
LDKCNLPLDPSLDIDYSDGPEATASATLAASILGPLETDRDRRLRRLRKVVFWKIREPT